MMIVPQDLLHLSFRKNLPWTVSLLTVVKLKLFVKNHSGFLITEVIKNSA